MEAATSFAVRAETDVLDPVLLVINMKNETGKYYFSLDNKDYTQYPEEKEILLQTGLIFKIESIDVKQLTEATEITVVTLQTNEWMAQK